MIEPPRHQDTKMVDREPIGEELDRLARSTVDAAFRVHSVLGPGLLESIYEQCFRHELVKRGLSVRHQVPVPIVYDGVRFEPGLRLDLVVNDELIVELKAVDTILPVHEAQLLSYLKLARKHLGLLINFNVPRIKDGMRRFALCLPWCLGVLVVQPSPGIIA